MNSRYRPITAGWSVAFVIPHAPQSGPLANRLGTEKEHKCNRVYCLKNFKHPNRDNVNMLQKK